MKQEKTVEIAKSEYSKITYSIAKFFWQRFSKWQGRINDNIHLNCIEDIDTEKITLDTKDKDFCLTVGNKAFGFDNLDEFENLLIKLNLIGTFAAKIHYYML